MSFNPLKIGSTCNLRMSIVLKVPLVSIPLKSGLHVMDQEQFDEMFQGVSIPLKSGLHVIYRKAEEEFSSIVSIPLKSGLHVINPFVAYSNSS